MITDPWLSVIIGLAVAPLIGLFGLWFAGVIGAEKTQRDKSGE